MSVRVVPGFLHPKQVCDERPRSPLFAHIWGYFCQPAVPERALLGQRMSTLWGPVMTPVGKVGLSVGSGTLSLTPQPSSCPSADTFLIPLIFSCTEALPPPGTWGDRFLPCSAHPAHQSWPRLRAESPDQGAGGQGWGQAGAEGSGGQGPGVA